MIAACKKITRFDNYEGSNLRGLIASDIQNDEAETIKVYEAMIETVPHNIKGYVAYYKYLKENGLKYKIEYITSKMIKNIDDPRVPTDDWMEAHVIRADALVELSKEHSTGNIKAEKINQAIETLEKLVHIIPPLPIPGLSYLAKLERRQIKEEEQKEPEEDGNIKFTYENQLVNSMKSLK